MRMRFWVPEKDSSDMPIDVTIPIKMEGYYYVDLLDKDTGEVIQHLEFPNVITDVGKNLLGTSQIANIIAFLEVGTGGAAPTTSDTALAAPLSPRSNNTGNNVGADSGAVTGSNGYVWRRISRILNDTEANGNLAELGFWTAGTGGTLFSRALFKDGTGTPTIVTKTNQNVLRVIYEYRFYPPQNNFVLSGSTNFRGTLYNYTLKASNIYSSAWIDSTFNFGNWITDSTWFLNNLTTVTDVTSSFPTTGAFAFGSDATPQAYVNGTYYRDANFRVAGTNRLYAGAILTYSRPSTGGTALNNGPQFQLAFSPLVSASGAHTLTMRLRLAWNAAEM